ncbi:hypothetical protein Nepgr_012318 [Nepenthes gracilis]|uniref:Uncharacterized protein n=1 Tax=Nepenthes gracilis TaxID=150966 RepID=A0AAD3SFX8_NEPGR|nr:hypothetical protein Nepgr_012318 [Nepenthes gracilis]
MLAPSPWTAITSSDEIGEASSGRCPRMLGKLVDRKKSIMDADGYISQTFCTLKEQIATIGSLGSGLKTFFQRVAPVFPKRRELPFFSVYAQRMSSLKTPAGMAKGSLLASASSSKKWPAEEDRAEVGP